MRRNSGRELRMKEHCRVSNCKALEPRFFRGEARVEAETVRSAAKELSFGKVHSEGWSLIVFIPTWRERWELVPHPFPTAMRQTRWTSSFEMDGERSGSVWIRIYVSQRTRSPLGARPGAKACRKLWFLPPHLGAR